ncbi:MBL fold metallo-hydrolase [Actinorhabdospora filicis]|uniref:MBL fold metallo-hydrolase n=1 Tax=Actinorhabdospora filicis TaxID=1785913 RepID=A0A9W6WA73_9ACTN|nr:MBL fold metallo-hydrolase [Actinorhabdospora filicis]GLZ78306.1 MBL fold metallo-hydrolase [Actinorhabdospora filicis]
MTHTVHTHTAGEAGLFVNAYLIETADGVIVIDTSLLNTEIDQLADRIDALGKPVLGIFVTHAHPDHFNGVDTLVRRNPGTPVYATEGVARVIAEIADAKRAQWGPVYGDEWPAVTALPTVKLADGEKVQFQDLSITARELGAGESHADSYLLLTPDEGDVVAFIGDIAFHGCHSYTADGHTGAWLENLSLLEGELDGVKVLYPGHGAPAGLELLSGQRAYLEFYRAQVAELAVDGQLDDAGKQELENRLSGFAPESGLTWMIQLGAPMVAAELSA